MNQRYLSWAPWLFVFLWSTGFIGSKMGAPYAEPLTFLCIRFVLVALLLTALVVLRREPMLNNLADYGHSAVVSVLLHGCYLGGVFIAIDRGVDAGFSALIVGLQPLLTVLVAAVWLRERITVAKLCGILLGLAGVALVVAGHGFSTVDMANIDQVGLGFCVLALIGITAGTLYQKRFGGHIPMLAGSAVQYAVVGALLYPLSLAFETQTIDWTPRFIFALAWLVLVLSIGAVLLLLWLLRRGEAGQVATLFYLVPPIVAVEAFVLFDERLSVLAAVGFLFCATGVALVVRTRAK